MKPIKRYNIISTVGHGLVCKKELKDGKFILNSDMMERVKALREKIKRITGRRMVWEAIEEYFPEEGDENDN